MTEKRHIYSGMKVLIDGKWVNNQAVIFEDGSITGIVPQDMIQHHLPAFEHHYDETHYLVPGFIDIHMHGIKGFDVMDATEEALNGISMQLAEEGVTGFLATTVATTADEIERVVTKLPKFAPNLTGAAMLGIHLEGPFISPEKLGAQPACLSPDLDLLKHWVSASGNTVKIVTLAPELPGAMDIVKWLHEKQIVAAIGHTDATYTETCDAIAAGVTHATHLFNAMRGFHRRGPGAVGALLLADTVKAELIVDGVHVHPAMIEMALRLKGRERIVLVTDSTRAKCMKAGCYDLGGQKVILEDGKAMLEDGTLAGSTLTMSEAIKNMTDYSHCDLADTIMMATGSPASVIGCKFKKGTIEVGKDADLAVLNEKLEVIKTIRQGKTIFSRAKKKREGKAT